MICLSKQIQTLRQWAQAHNITIEIRKNHSDFFYVSKKKNKYIKKITVQKRNSPDKHLELFYLLHEIGHLITFENREKWMSENLRYTIDFTINEEVEGEKDWYLVSTVTEEHDAWRNGKLLARQLKLELDEKAYDAEWLEAIKDYIMYAATKMQKYMTTVKHYV